MVATLNKQELLDTENRRYKAMIDGDLNALEKILSNTSSVFDRVLAN